MIALIKAWRQLYNRRRHGETDAWVPASQKSRARSTRGLATDDWRAVATAVNRFRTTVDLDPIRTHTQCKRRVERLKSRFGDNQLATPSWYGFVPVVCNNTAGGRRHSGLRVLANAAMEARDGGAAGGQARGGSALAEGGVVMGVPVGAATENASDGVAVEEGGTATAPTEALGSGATSEDPPSGPVDRLTAAATDFLGGPIPKKRRTGASTSAGAGDGRSPSVKEELVREANARRARVDEGRAPAGGFAATAAEMAAVLGEVVAAESNDVAVMAKLSEMFKEASTMYREITMERMELQKQMVAALAATTGGAAAAAPYMPAVGV